MNMTSASVITMLALNLKTKQGHSRMNKHTLLLTALFLNLICTPVFAQNWQVATFGQSTDLNFSSLINSVRLDGIMHGLRETIIFLKQENFTLYQQIFLLKVVGEKIANSMTV